MRNASELRFEYVAQRLIIVYHLGQLITRERFAPIKLGSKIRQVLEQNYWPNAMELEGVIAQDILQATACESVADLYAWADTANFETIIASVNSAMRNLREEDAQTRPSWCR